MRLRCLASLGLANVLCVGCTTLRPVTPEQLTGANRPDSVFVTETDHWTLVLHQPRVVGDTLEGMLEGLDTVRRVPLSQANAIQAEAPANGHTAALVVGLVAVPAAIVTYFVMTHYNHHISAPSYTCECDFDSICCD